MDEEEILVIGRELFEEDSLLLCKERLVALDFGYVFPAIIGIAAVTIRLSSGDWRDAIDREILPQVTDDLKRTGLSWAFDALEAL